MTQSFSMYGCTKFPYSRALAWPSGYYGQRAAFHKFEESQQPIQKAQRSTLCLPPYSPNFNPIETF
ncbi:MAG: hypothetical protein QRY74_01020 [Chlamydia sp.]